MFKKSILLFIILLLGVNLYSQQDTSGYTSDSLLFRESDLKRVSMNYFNLSKPYKLNFEVVVIGGVKNPGVYLVPEGTTLVEVVALTGGAQDESILENFKLIRTKNKNPQLKSDTVYVLNYDDFFDKEKSGSISKINPTLRPGDIITFPIKPEKEFWDIAQRVAGVVVVPLLTALTLILNIMIYNK